MDQLPPELIHRILDLLPSPTLAYVSALNSDFYWFGMLHLYSRIELYIDPYTSNIDAQSAQLVFQLFQHRILRGRACLPLAFVREVAVLPTSTPSFPVEPVAFRSLWMILFQLLRNGNLRGNLRAFQWRIAYPNIRERMPFSIPPDLRVLECYACHIDSIVTFPNLQSLSLYRVTEEDTKWINRQVQHCKLHRLSISGVKKADLISLSTCLSGVEKNLQWLKKLHIANVELDACPVPWNSLLEDLSLRNCLVSSYAIQACARNMTDLRVLTVVSDHDVYGSSEFTSMLLSCRNLRELTLLIGGRELNLPIDLVLPLGSSLETLVLESRQVSTIPAANHCYTIKDLNTLMSYMPTLRNLGLPVRLEEFQNPSIKLELGSNMKILHIRNLLSPQQSAKALFKLEAAARHPQAKHHEMVLMLGSSCYCYELRGMPNGTIQAASISPAAYKPLNVVWNGLE